MKTEVASRRIESFGQRFGEAHLYLAYHAAFPLALTPDLLYRLWANFQRDIHKQKLKIPWLAVADLLLSNLYDEVGHELYEMDTAVRNSLLKELKGNPRFGEKRINELSDFLLVYVQQQLESHDLDMRDFAQAQRWTALAYTRPSEAAHELALTLSKLKLTEKAEWVRMTSLVETFAEPMADFQPLFFYSRGMRNFARGNLEGASAEFSNISSRDNDQVYVAGVNLPIPSQINLYSAMILKLIWEYYAQGKPYQKIQIPYHNQLPAEVLKKLELPEGIDFNYGIVIDGKAPNWLYSYLAYKCRNAAWIGCYYPQLEGAVVVHSQTPTVEVGQIQGSTKNNLLNGNLELKVNEVITVDGDRYQCLLIHAVDISPQALDSLTLPSNLNWNREIVLWGQAPTWLYTHLVMRCQQALWVACYNIRTIEAVVVVSQCSELVPGDKFKLVPKSPCPAIVFGGHPNSGKSLLAYTLKQTLVKMGWNNKVYLHRTRWDGEGDWFAQMVGTNPELANKVSEIAGRWKKPENTAEYFSQQAEVIKEIRRNKDLVLVDIGSMPREADKILLPSCSHYIIISNSSEGVAEWHKFFQILKTDTQEQLIPLAVIHSVEEKKVKILNREPYLEMIVGPWRYGETETVPQELLEEVIKLIRE